MNATSTPPPETPITMGGDIAGEYPALKPTVDPQYVALLEELAQRVAQNFKLPGPIAKIRTLATFTSSDAEIRELLLRIVMRAP